MSYGLFLDRRIVHARILLIMNLYEFVHAKCFVYICLIWCVEYVSELVNACMMLIGNDE